MIPATFVYDNAWYMFATKALNWATSGAAMHCVLVDNTYAPNPHTDQFFSAVPTGAVLVDQAFTSTAVRSNGVCYGVIPLITLLSADPVVGMLIYLDVGGIAANSPLIYYSNQGNGFPFTPQGFSYSVGYDLLAGGWFQV
jgi:hypothetical protein